MGKKVVKFGGSSLADASQFKKVADIILSDSSRKYVVPSAPGKRFSEDIKVTDMLYSCYEMAKNEEDFIDSLNSIKARYDGIISELEIELSLDNEFEIIKENFKTKAGSDYAASRGEYLNGIVLAKYLGYEFVDPADVIFFDENGKFDSENTNVALREKLLEIKKAVIPGFYGSLPGKKIKTFSRGGSDVTGSIVARAVNADMYENWTDVSGFLICDPRIVNNPEPITVITYRELRELSYMGATVLHEDAIFPVRKAKIPINIKNTNAPMDDGTFIVDSADNSACKYTITGIAGKKGFAVINLEKDMMNNELGFGRKVLEVLERNEISFEHVPSGIDTLSVIVNRKDLEAKEDKVVDEIKGMVSPDNIEIERDLALLAVVGRGMKSTRGTAGRIFSALSHSHVNVKMIDQGSSELNIIVGVAESDFEKATKCIYDIFVMQQL